jgi:methionyl-tRNA formyltransferase
LELLKNRFKIALVITQPDTTGGRNRKKVIIPAAKTFALENNLEVIQPGTLKDDTLVEKISRDEPFLGVAISYG